MKTKHLTLALVLGCALLSTLRAADTQLKTEFAQFVTLNEKGEYVHKSDVLVKVVEMSKSRVVLECERGPDVKPAKLLVEEDDGLIYATSTISVSWGVTEITELPRPSREVWRETYEWREGGLVLDHIVVAKVTPKHSERVEWKAGSVLRP